MHTTVIHTTLSKNEINSVCEVCARNWGSCMHIVMHRLHPVAMALMSPRVFWNVVRCANIGREALASASSRAGVCFNCMRVHVPTVTHTEFTFAGPGKSFEQGCRELAPELNWTRVFERTRKLKYSSLEWAQ
eukprot:m.803390 g.803390  ORF g.803390 m.803390 type:complete len:132 (+) comp23365_c0_seq2:2250-2645(+)